MNIKNKNSSKRKDSHSKEHTPSLRSASKSNQKSKHRSDSKLIFRLKTQEFSQLNKDQQNSRLDQCNPSINRLNQKKMANGKRIEGANEYYNHYRVKSKSKGKLIGEEEATKNKYFNSIYMHKQDNQANFSHVELSQKALYMNEKHRGESDQIGSHSNVHLINKIKMIQKNGSIDANGKFVVKETKYNQPEIGKNLDSQHTISIYEGEKKREKWRKKDKTRKQTIKTKTRKDEKTENNKLAGIRSADKFTKKKELKDIASPSILQRPIEKYQLNEVSRYPESIRQNTFIKGKDILKLNNPPLLSSRTSKTILSEQTQTSPQIIDHLNHLSQTNRSIENIVRELAQDKQEKFNVKKLRLIYHQLLFQRVKSIQFVSRLCLSLNIRREALSLTIYYMDKYLLILGKEVTPRQLRLIAMTALMLAVKIDDGIMSRKICYEYINHMDSLLSSSKGFTKSNSIQKHKQAISAFSSKETSTIIKSKGNLSNTQLALPKDETKKSRKQQAPSSKEMNIILSLEMDMLIKFNFKLVQRSSTYWIDTLTTFWDDYICQVAEQENLYFRSEKNKRNISHCYQILEMLPQDLSFYEYCTPLIVLGTMYLITRMRLEEQKQNIDQKQIYTKYINSLSKSTNLIFYDNVGINELFGDFLFEFEMNLSQIIECIQYVGRNLITTLKVYSFTPKSKHINLKTYQHKLSIYEASPELYRYGEGQD